MNVISLKLLKADVIKTVSKTGVIKGEDNRLSYSKETSSIKITGKVADLIQDCDLIELGEGDNTHFIDSIRIEIRLNQDDSKNDITRAFYLENDFDFNFNISPNELYIGCICLKEKDFFQVEGMLKNKFNRINLSFYRPKTKAEMAQEEASSIDDDNPLIEVKSTRLEKEIKGEKKLIIALNRHDMIIGSYEILYQAPKFLKKEEWLEDIESISYCNQIIESKHEEEEQEQEIKNAEKQFEQITLNQQNAGKFKDIKLLLFVIAALLLVIIFKI